MSLLLQTVLIWMINFGWQTSLKFLFFHPSYFLLSLFSPFMISLDKTESGQVIAISQKWTWINFALSVVGSIGGDLIIARVGSAQDFSRLSLLSFLSSFVPTLICLLILFLKHPILHRTGVDVTDFSRIIDFQASLDNQESDLPTEVNMDDLKMYDM